MSSPLIPLPNELARSGGNRPGKRLLTYVATRWPFVCLFAIALLCNVAASLFSIGYNHQLIVDDLEPAQKAAFWKVVLGNNAVMFTLCLSIVGYLFWPLARCRADLLAGRTVERTRLVNCQRGLINLPLWQLCINLVGWLPGAVVFPLGICLLSSDWSNADRIWMGFGVSFVVSALMATVQTFFLMEAFQLRYLYNDFFREDRPTEVSGVVRISLRFRFLAYWFAVAVVPLIALLAVFLHPNGRQNPALAWEVTLICFASSAILGAVTGRTFLSWLKTQAVATKQITQGNYKYRIQDKRPGDFGRLTDRFNDMAAALDEAQHMRDTFGQIVGPKVRDEIMKRPILGGEVQEVTVLFADIRGFTTRSAGAAPETVVAVLNRFLSLALAVVEERDGLVNKFLGDGFMALFNAPLLRQDHADLAVAAACGLLARLDRLNDELAAEGQAPLQVGIGIHTGPALVGSIGATVTDADGRNQLRREYTAIGETVNLAQRIEQLTKTCGGPLLISEQTRLRLVRPILLSALDPQLVPGCATAQCVHRVMVCASDSNGHLAAPSTRAQAQ
jgi:adenylate cyclase